jgi:hypothetical protein
MHFANEQLNPRFQVVALNSAAFIFCTYGI